LSASVVARSYDFIVCGSGSSGSVVAGRLAENPDVTVLLLEAGGSDAVPEVMLPHQWPLNIGTERDWSFVAMPNPHLNGRSIPLAMGKVLGGGSSINLMHWARGHKSDWDYFASEAGDESWSYESVLNIYRRIEDWHGAPDADYRGVGGPVCVQPAPDPCPLAPAVVEAARAAGLPTFDSSNGAMTRGHAGASITDLRIRDGQRESVYRSYVWPHRDQPNLTVLTGALVTRLTLDVNRVTGVEFVRGETLHTAAAGSEVVVSLGALNTPKLLMQSGIGDADDLQSLGIKAKHHLPGVGRNYQDHPRIGCVWESPEPLRPQNGGAEATFYAKSRLADGGPDLQVCVAELAMASTESAARFGLPEHGFTLCGGVVQPKSRGQVRLTGPEPGDPVEIEQNMLAHPDDMKLAIELVELCREVGNGTPLRKFVKREVIPGNLARGELEDFVRDATETYDHSVGTSKMGRDEMAVVDGNLKVHGLDGVRIADGSIMPRITTGNTMAPCVVIGERAAEILRAEYAL
jgi:choline dehydrogenase